VLSYAINVEKDAKFALSFPETYEGNNLINIIEPLYDNLKSGEKIKFKFKSDIENIVISNGEEKEHLKKNENGFFEKEIVIKAKPGGNIQIGQSFGFMTSYYYRYNVI